MLVFMTAVKHPNNSKSYEDVWRLLNDTLYSVCSQNHTDFRVIVVCDQKLPLFHHQELIHKYTDFIEVDFPSHGDDVIERFNTLGNLSPPIDDKTRWIQWSQESKKQRAQLGQRIWHIGGRVVARLTKKPQRPMYMSAPEIKLMANYALNRGTKQLIGILAAKKYNPDYVLIFDADDYVGNDIAAYVNARLGENGWIMTHGYKMAGNLIAPFYAKNSFCGTGNIISYALLLEDIPGYLDVNSSQDELFRHVDSDFLVVLARHGKVRGHYKKKGQEFLDYPHRSAVHLLGHQESNDFLRRILREETSGLRLAEAQKHAAFTSINQDLIEYFSIFSIEEATPHIKRHAMLDKDGEEELTGRLLLKTQKNDITVNKPVKFSSELTKASFYYHSMGSYLSKTALYPSDIPYNLTISDKKKFIWFRVGKVGSRTILDVFRQANIELAAEHPFDVHYPVNSYKSYFRFAFVRNPWDRLVSYWRDKVIRRNKFDFSDSEQGFESFVDYIAMKVDMERGNPHLRLQSSLIDLNHIDFLGRFENFQTDLREVMGLLDIEATIKKKNASGRKADYHEYYTERTREKVAELYKKDIRIFNYEF